MNFRNHNDNHQFSPVQSDTEFEVGNRPKSCEETTSDDTNQQLLSNGPSWKWGELPSPLPKPDIQELPGKKEPVMERDCE